LPIAWDDPGAWTRLAPSNPARLANYLIRRAGGDSEDAEVSVFYFGPDEGGDPEDNLDRWLHQFTEAKKPRRFTRKVNGMRQTVAEIEGTFVSGMPGGPPGPTKPGFRLHGAIVETPVGLYFFKMTGPRTTVLGARSAFMTMLDSVRKKRQ
jgi:hypothetical protein